MVKYYLKLALNLRNLQTKNKIRHIANLKFSIKYIQIRTMLKKYIIIIH